MRLQPLLRVACALALLSAGMVTVTHAQVFDFGQIGAAGDAAGAATAQLDASA
jgi:hypothetical protein